MKHCLLGKVSITIYIIVSKKEMFCFLDESPGNGTFLCLYEGERIMDFRKRMGIGERMVDSLFGSRCLSDLVCESFSREVFLYLEQMKTLLWCF